MLRRARSLVKGRLPAARRSYSSGDESARRPQLDTEVFERFPATPRRGGKRYRQPYRALWRAAACLACCRFDADGNVPSPLKRKQACALQRRATKSCKENTNSQRSITNRSSFVLARRMRALPEEHD